MPIIFDVWNWLEDDNAFLGSLLFIIKYLQERLNHYIITLLLGR